MNLPSATGRADRHLEGFADPEARLRAGTPLPHGFLLFLKLLRVGRPLPHGFQPFLKLLKVGMPLPHGFPLFLKLLKVGTPLPHGFPLFLKPLRAVTLPPQNFRPSGVLERAGRAFPSQREAPFPHGFLPFPGLLNPSPQLLSCEGEAEFLLLRAGAGVLPVV